MSIGEERFYQTLWHARETDGVFRESAQTKTCALGYDRLAKLTRLDEKSVRQLIPRLAAKQILEVIASENCSARVGKTYRIFSYEEILQRQRAAGLEFIVKRGRAVEFVDPQTGSPVQTPTVGEPPSVGKPPTETVGESPTVSVGESPTPLDKYLDNSFSHTSSSVFEALRCYGPADDDAVRTILAASLRAAADATEDEIVHFIHEKGRATRGGRIANPLAYLIVYVPKCFQPEVLTAYREAQREAARHRKAAEERAAAEMEQMRQEWQRWLTDPAASDEDKAWARKMLAEAV